MSPSLLIVQAILLQNNFFEIPAVDFRSEEFTTYSRKTSMLGAGDWFPDNSSTTYPNERVPTEVKDSAAQWISMTLNRSIVPVDLKSRLRGNRQPKMDFVFVRYGSQSFSRIQIVEDTGDIFVTVKCPQPFSAESIQSASERVVELTKLIFNFRSEDHNSLVCQAKRVGGSQSPLIRGSVSSEPNEFKVNAWWKRVNFLTDGDSLQLRITKVLPETFNDSSAGATSMPYVPRFGNP